MFVHFRATDPAVYTAAVQGALRGGPRPLLTEAPTGARRSGGYEHELTDRDHRELVERVIAYDGAVVPSCYRNPIYAPLEEAGWEAIEVPVVCSAAGRTRASGLQGEGNVLRKQKRTEVIWRKAE